MLGCEFGIAPLKDIAGCSNCVRPPAAGGQGAKAAWETAFADHLKTTEDPILRTTEGPNRDTIAMGSAGGPPALAAFDGDLGGHGTTEAGEKAVADHLHTMEDSVRDATEGPTRDTIVMESAGGQPALAGFDDDLSENSLAGMADDCCDFDLAELEPRMRFCSSLLRARTQGPNIPEQDPYRAKICVGSGLRPSGSKQDPMKGQDLLGGAPYPPTVACLGLPGSFLPHRVLAKPFHDDLLGQSDFPGLGPVDSRLCGAVDCTCLADVNCLSSPTPPLGFRSPSFCGSPLALATDGPNCVKAPLLAGRPAHLGHFPRPPPSGLGSPSHVLGRCHSRTPSLPMLRPWAALPDLCPRV